MSAPQLQTIKAPKQDVFDDETYTTVNFNVDGKTVSARMTSAMVAFLNENENLKKQIIEKLLADSAMNNGETVVKMAENKEPEDVPTAAQPEGSGDDQQFRWYVDPTLKLLDIYFQHLDEFKSRIVKKAQLWEKISKEMEDKGFKVTANACDRKMRNLKAGYKAKQKKAVETGRTCTWIYFSHLDKIFGDVSDKGEIMWESDNESYTSDDTSSCCDISDPEFCKYQTSNDSYLGNKNKNKQCKKRRLSIGEDTEDVHEAWAFELMRRTYLQVERRKAKAMSKLTNELMLMRRMQEERNSIMKSMLEEMRKMNS